MLLSTSKEGFVEGILKGGKILLWHVGANAVVVLVTLLSSVKIDASDEKYAIYAAAIALANAVLAGIGKWLRTVEPADAAKGLTGTTERIQVEAPESQQPVG